MSKAQERAPIAAAGGRKCILVLGMHRAGTSALARMLNLLGAALPRHLMGADLGNEKGHWEPERLVALHDDILAGAGSRWDDWRSFVPTMLDPEKLAHYKAEIARIVAEEYDDEPLFVVKDPRLCRLMPLWREVLDETGIQAGFVIPFRSPLEVARSLEKRDGLPLPHACLLWLRHVLDAERETRGFTRVFVHYHELLNDPGNAAVHIASRLAEERLAVNEENKRQIESWIDPEQRHHVAGSEELCGEDSFYPWLRVTYEACAVLVRQPTDSAAQRQLDRVRSAFDPATATFAPLLAEREMALRERDGRIATLNQALTARETALKGRDERISALIQMLAAREQTLREREEQFRKLDQMLMERTREVAALHETMAERNAALAKYEEKLAAREEAIRALFASTSWRVTAPLRATRRFLGKR